ncbi:hypothetical protein KIL84_010550 [Mauremys mutica]|uniref:Uncharacterized protein n=1 Tax=Mauremys mutica TaxID=74926 RepID=A0A9D4B054_9SAUR|nr:hypothetical protein KIL84_010550 [Mauremys mutica]
MLWGNIQMLTILKWVMKQLYMTKLSRGIFVLGNNAVFSASLCIKMEKSLDVLTWFALHNWFVFKRLDWVFMSKTDAVKMHIDSLHYRALLLYCLPTQNSAVHGSFGTARNRACDTNLQKI